MKDSRWHVVLHLAALFSVVTVVMGACDGRESAASVRECGIAWSVAPLGLDTVAGEAPSLVGSIVDSRSGALVGAALVRLTAASGTRDSIFTLDGTFRFERPRTGKYEIRVMRIGYRPRRDTLHVGDEVSSRITLPIDQAASDECGGLDVVIQKPWWKFW